MIRVFILEDSRTLMRELIKVFGMTSDFKVIGTATTIASALEQIPALKPDLVSLDVFLPDGSAADAVTGILRIAPVPIVLLSEAKRETDEVFAALAAGAVDFMRKPRAVDKRSTAAMLNAMRALSRVALRARPSSERCALAMATSVVAFASSTGGPNALREILAALPADFPLPILVAQHVAEGFEAGLAKWLAAASPLRFRVMEKQRQALTGGEVVLGRSGWDMRVVSREEVVLEKAPVRGYHPSGDMLFKSASKAFGSSVIAVVLSGIGSDGAAGALEVARAGGVVMAQDERSSVVYGMPAAVAEAGIAGLIGSPVELGRAILHTVTSKKS
ncbi:MAG: chemotaxis protein CheB [Myxococcaceae bacterium]